MKRIYKNIICVALNAYTTLVLGNAAIHGCESIIAYQESIKPYYGDNLRQEWVDYSKRHLDSIADSKILVPFSFKGSLDRPLEVDFSYTGPEGIELKIDLAK